LAGTYVLRLTANDGALEGSDELTVTVTATATAENQPPQVDAGSGMSIQLPTASATLMASVTDDGLPGTALSLTWSQLSGPATALFGAADAASTLVTFSAAGSYVLQLTADDGALAASDDVTVTVNAAADPGPAPETEPPPTPEPETEPPPAAEPAPPPAGSGGNPAPASPPSAGGTSGGGSFGLIELSLFGLIALGRAARFRSRVPSAARISRRRSVLSERRADVDPGCPARGHIGGEHRHGKHGQRYEREHPRIERARFIELARDDLPHGDRTAEP
jgi:hypothetical protein